MKVYVLAHWWDDDESDGRCVLGVYQDVINAKSEMHRLAQETKVQCENEFDELEWDDCSFVDEMTIYLACGVNDPFVAMKEYGWEISEHLLL